MSSQPTGRQRMSRSKLSCCLIAVTFVLLGASSLYGDGVPVLVGSGDYIGCRSSGSATDDCGDILSPGGGIIASEQWASGGFELSWEITDNQNGTFTYEYLITGEGGGDLGPPDLSHWILELTPPEELWDGKFDFLVDLVITEIDVRLYEAGEPPNPDLPEDLFGVKFEFDVEEGTYHVTFTTEQVPVWGNFFATGGDDYAYNTGFATMPDAGTTDFTYWIARPDGATSLPEPSTLVLLLSGTGLLAGAARFRKKT